MKNILKGAIPALAVVFSLSSCLKEDNIQQDITKFQPIIEIPDASPNLDGAPNSLTAAVVGVAQAIPYSIPVNYAFDGASPGVDVTIDVDAATLAKYNTVKKTDVKMLPAKFFSIPSKKINIASGQNQAPFVINLLNTTDPDLLTTQYAIPLKITDASGKNISGNYGSIVALIKIKNIYDGSYAFKGNIKRFLNATDLDPALSGNFSGEHADLLTNTANSVWFDSQLWSNGSGVAGIGTPEVDGVLFTVGADNKVTITCAATPTLRNTTGYDSRYDPATKTFYVAFEWGATKRAAIDTLTME